MKFEELAARARNAFIIQDYELAERLALKLDEAVSDHPGVLLLLGNIYAKTKDRGKAIKYFQKAIELHPENPEAYNNIGIVYKQAENTAAALNALSKAFSLAPERADIAYNLGNIYKESGDYAAARDYYQKAIDLNPAFVLPYNNLGTMLEQEGDHAAAVKLYHRGLENDANHPTLRYNLGITYQAEAKDEKAIEQFRQALKSRPGWVDGLNNLGISLQKTGRHNEALRMFKEIEKLDPGNPQVKNNLGVVLNSLGKPEEAEIYYRDALETNPEYTKAAVNLEQLHIQEGYHEEALAGLVHLLEKEPRNVDIRLHLIKVLSELRRFREASEHLRFVIEADPKNPKVHNAAGNLYKRAGKYRRALISYGKVLELCPDSAEARLNKAYIYRDLGEYENAIAEISQVLALNPTAFEPRLLLGNLYLYENLYGEALGIFKDLYDEYPEDQDLLTAMIRTYKAMGDQRKAVQMAEKLVEIQGSGDSSDDLEHLDATLELYEQALDDYAQNYEELWQRNINALKNAGQEPVDEGIKGEEEDSLLVADIPDLEGESVPIIEVGGIDPVIAINEEEETIHLTEMEEELPFIPELPEEEEEPERISVAPDAGPHQPEAPTQQASSATPGSASPDVAPEKRRDAPGESLPSENGGTRGAGQDMDENGKAENEGSAGPDSASDDEKAPGQEPPPFRGIISIESPITITPVRPEKPGKETGYRISMEASPGRNSAGKITGKIRQGPAHNKEDKTEVDSGTQAEEEEKKKPKRPEDLFDYLEGLTRYLPETVRQEFERSEMHLRMETLRRRMMGYGGLKRFVETKFPERAGTQSQNRKSQLSGHSVTKALSFMGKLSGFIPDKDIREALHERIAQVVGRLQENDTNGNNME